MRRYDLELPDKAKTASELERQHERKGRNIVSLSAARHRRDWNRHVATWNGGNDDHAA